LKKTFGFQDFIINSKNISKKVVDTLKFHFIPDNPDRIDQKICFARYTENAIVGIFLYAGLLIWPSHCTAQNPPKFVLAQYQYWFNNSNTCVINYIELNSDPDDFVVNGYSGLKIISDEYGFPYTFTTFQKPMSVGFMKIVLGPVGYQDPGVVREFQKQLGLRYENADGSWGSGTWKALINFIKDNHKKRIKIGLNALELIDLNKLEINADEIQFLRDKIENHYYSNNNFSSIILRYYIESSVKSPFGIERLSINNETSFQSENKNIDSLNKSTEIFSDSITEESIEPHSINNKKNIIKNSNASRIGVPRKDLYSQIINYTMLMLFLAIIILYGYILHKRFAYDRKNLKSLNDFKYAFKSLGIKVNS